MMTRTTNRAPENTSTSFSCSGSERIARYRPSMVSRRETCGMMRCRMRSSRSVAVKRASCLPHLLRMTLTSWASIQKNARINSAARISLAQNMAAPSVSCGRNRSHINDSTLFTEHPFEDRPDMLEMVVQVKGLADPGFTERPDHLLVGQQLRLEI